MAVKNNKISLVVLFAVLLATPYVISHYDHFKKMWKTNADQKEALKRYGFYLKDVTNDWGVHFTHHAPKLDSKLDHIMPQVASVGASVSVTDFNNDGRQDFYLTNSRHGEPNALYENLGNGNFKNVAPQMGIANVNTKETGVSMSATWGDYDNDGYEDLFIAKWGKPILFHNDQGKGFTKVNLGSEFPDWVNSNTAVWFDYDNDGLLDLFLGGYYDENIDLWNLKTTKIMPESFEYARNGGQTYLFHNLGNGKFKEVSKKLGVISNRWTYAAAAADVDHSGYPDLILANDYGVDQLFLNQQGKGFVNAAEKVGIGFTPKSGMNVSLGDVMNRGRFAIYITNISEPGVLIQGNSLWVPTVSSEKLRYQNLAEDLGIELGGWSYGAQFGDLNLDGNQDLYVANGYVSGKKGTDYWYDFSKVAGGNKKIIADAKNWPAMKGRSLSGYQQNKIWMNDGSGKFQEVADAVGGKLKLDSRAVALADLNNDGTLEILIASQGAPFKIYKNTVTASHNWIGFKLKGTKSNSSAIGTEVEIYWNSTQQIQIVNATSGFSAENQRPLYFGLGKSNSVQKAVIHWPSGYTQTLKHPKINTLHTITETIPS